MMRSLYSGVSGLRVHQTKMDVIGNNIANVNTVGFKSSSVNFSDVFYQTTQSASGPNEATGAAGQNAMQIGLGSSVASITAAITQTGGSQRTDNPFDVMINGDAFFIVNSGGTNYFTKAGAFNIDANGTLCTSTGATVMGWGVDDKDPTKTVAAEVKPLQVMSAKNLFSPPVATTNATVTGNIDNQDTQIQAGATGRPVSVNFYDNTGHSYTAELNVIMGTKNDEFHVTVNDITDSNSQSIFSKKSIDAATGKETYGASAITTFTFGGLTYTVAAADINKETGKVNLKQPTTGFPTIKFDAANGKFTGVTPDVTDAKDSFVLDISASPDPFPKLAVDFSTVTMYGKSSSGASTGTSLSSDRGNKDSIGKGKKVGNLSGINIDNAGKIFGIYDNGDKILLGQIATASFANPAGLESVGNSMFAETQNSGEFDGIGQDISANGGKFTTGVLEMSNVDLSAQFTEMITTQRGFQANSRIITTSDTLLEELINLKR